MFLSDSQICLGSGQFFCFVYIKKQGNQTGKLKDQICVRLILSIQKQLLHDHLSSNVFLWDKQQLMFSTAASFHTEGWASECEQADFPLPQACDGLHDIRKLILAVPHWVPLVGRHFTTLGHSHPRGEREIKEEERGGELGVEGEIEIKRCKMCKDDNKRCRRRRYRWGRRSRNEKQQPESKKKSANGEEDGGMKTWEREWLLAAHFSTYEPICTAPRVGRHHCTDWND